MQGLFFAIRTLTRLPIGSKPLEEEEQSLKWFPLVGLLFGIVGWAIPFLPLPPATLAALTLAAWAYLSRGFHLDGLADLADGLGGGFTAERTLEIMRDSHIGVFGTLALVCALLIQYSTLSALVAVPPALLLTPVLSRAMLVIAAAALPYARAGSGSAQKLVSGATVRHTIIVMLQLLLLGLLLYFFGDRLLFIGYLWAAGAAVFVAIVLLWIVKRRIGGVTGDVLGAIAVLSECGALIGFLLPLA